VIILKPKRIYAPVKNQGTASFENRGRLVSANVELKKKTQEMFETVFHRTLRHSKLGKLTERIRLSQLVEGKPSYGRVEIHSDLHGPIGIIHFEKSLTAKNTYGLHSFEINHWAQAEGLGTQIFAETINELKKVGAKRVTLSVSLKQDNSAEVLKMYKKFGFVIMEPQPKIASKNNLKLVLDL
jgi:L-amino acid N-acyltransferase YncA